MSFKKVEHQILGATRVELHRDNFNTLSLLRNKIKAGKDLTSAKKVEHQILDATKMKSVK